MAFAHILEFYRRMSGAQGNCHDTRQWGLHKAAQYLSLVK